MDGIDTQLIGSLILPPSGTLLLALLGLLLWWSAFGRKLVVFALLLQLLLSLPVTAELLFSHLQKYPPLSRQQLSESQASAIVVLGAGRYREAPEYASDTASMRHLSRLRYAARIARQTGLPVIPSGGKPDGTGVAEAVIAEQVLKQDFGLSVQHLEKRSKNTWENARYVARLLDGLAIERVILVTDAAHMARALYALQRHGVDAIAAPTNFEYHQSATRPLHERLIPSASAVMNISFGLHELLGRFWYSLK
ncbi:MAG: YdcF family protein [Candidatus Thiodiazotropha taylori]|nr:YdcF family protein [Candidatus Thiodiazotropha taylori]MCG7918186.1 YdcF family protein [Candidatus Thiodiazotropha taylori]MCG7934488.1 YdcF family protein [Candidatus Thiodiazotropha taylori]MCG7943945.1 YdcF family protein [Candidatus Thiodiazotropha taylori]MCG7970285.1 YdcF family protein [Candidatus Thiodiazotropha taylori]